MLRFDRYLVARSSAIDVATGSLVDLQHAPDRQTPIALFESREGRTLIDCEAAGRGRFEVWERWIPASQPPRLSAVVANFSEMLECARLGAPRAFDLDA